MSIMSENGELFSEVGPDHRTLRAIRIDLDGEFRRWKVELALRAYFQRHVLAGNPKLDRAYCYGVSEGEILLETPACSLLQSDSGLSISVSIEQSGEGSDKKASEFSPELAYESPAGGGSGKLGSLSSEKAKSQTKRVEYTIDEDLIAVVPHRSGVNCMVTKLGGAGIGLEYIYSSFTVNVLLRGQRKDFHGSVVVRPGAFSIYDPAGRKLPDKLSVWAMLLAFKEGRYPGRAFSEEYKVPFAAQVIR